MQFPTYNHPPYMNRIVVNNEPSKDMRNNEIVLVCAQILSMLLSSTIKKTTFGRAYVSK